MWNELFSYSKIVIYIYILSLKFLSLTVRTISDDGWNQIQFNLADFTRRAYGTNYVETLRVQIHANCRIRRVYFSDRLYSEDELPAEFKLYLPVSMKRILIEFVWPWYRLCESFSCKILNLNFIIIGSTKTAATATTTAKFSTASFSTSC